jgi:hypothetical protein
MGSNPRSFDDLMVTGMPRAFAATLANVLTSVLQSPLPRPLRNPSKAT